MVDEPRWNRLSELFERLLAAADPAAVLAAEPDPEIRREAEALWAHHIRASREDFLGHPLQFQVRPMFQPGQVLVRRFRIERMLGSGGMGEVYLAMDLRIEELLALKTVARLLAFSPAIRRRILVEVQNARRVTHPNVCRIHDLFEDGETVFFTMEYVQGRLLSEVFSDPLILRRARHLVRQMAEGLQAAHETGVVHGDFKPGNVIIAGSEVPRAVIMDFGLAHALDRTAAQPGDTSSVRAGTAEYMAPELAAGSQPTIRSDIFAFGRVARLLLPGNRLWDECTAAHPEDRPKSLDPIIRSLQPSTSRRVWMLGSTLFAAGMVGYSVWPRPQRTFIVPAGARLLVNGFHSLHPVAGIRLARSLLLTALQQSTRLRAIADQDLLAALARRQPGAGSLPLSGNLLQSLLTELRAAFWIDGDLNQRGARYSLNLRLSRVSDGRMISEVAFRDLPGVIDVAQQAALWLRTAAGESDRSLALNPAAATTYTSKVPEALDKYYDAMEHYAVAAMDEAIPLLEEAVRLDPGFAQAHSMLGMCINPSKRYDQAFVEVARAKELAQARGFPERERGWILANYYTLSEDPGNMVASAIQNADYYPDEPRFQRILAHTLSRTGRATEAVDHYRKAVELAPNDDLLRAGLIDSLCEAGRPDEALNEYQVAIDRGGRDRWLHGGAGLAFLGLERYSEARDAFAKEPEGRYRNLDLQRPKILEGDLDSAIAALREHRSGARNAVDAHQSNEFLCGLYFAADQPGAALVPLREMADLPPYPPMARRLDCTAFWAYRLGADDVLTQAHGLLSKIRSGWDNDFTRTVERHAAALRSWRRGALDEAESQILDASDLGFSPWRWFDAAELYAARDRPDRAEDYWQLWDQHRGTILEFWFPGALVMGWLGRAVAAQRREQPAAARKYSRKVLDHWAANNSGLKIVRMALAIHNASKSA